MLKMTVPSESPVSCVDYDNNTAKADFKARPAWPLLLSAINDIYSECM